MILDKVLEFADDTSVGTPNNSTVNVGNIFSIGDLRDIGRGTPVYLVVQVTTAITSGGAATVAFVLASDSTTTIAVDGTATKHSESKAFAVASLVSGFQVVIPLPWEEPDYEKFIAFQIKETAGQALTAGKVNAFLTLEPSAYKAYPDAVN